MTSFQSAGGGGEGAGFQLFTQSDNNPGIYADAAARDAYFGANPADLTIMDQNEFLIIKLLDNGFAEVAYQQRQNLAWVDVTSLIQGETGATGAAGATGNSYFFPSILERDNFFNIIGNTALLTNGLPIVVNIDVSRTTSFVWFGATAPPTYDASLWIVAEIEVGAGTIVMGENGVMFGPGNNVLNFVSPDGAKHYMHGVEYDDTGSDKPEFFIMDPKTFELESDVFDTALSSPRSLQLPTNANAFLVSFKLRPSESGALRIELWLGVDDTGPKLNDTILNVPPGDVGNEVDYLISTDLYIEAGQIVYVTFSGIDLFGGVQTSGPFIGQSVVSFSEGLQLTTSTNFAYQRDDSFTLKAPTSLGAAALILDDFEDTRALTLIVTDTAGDPILTENAPFGKLLTYNAGDDVLVTHLGTKLNYEFSSNGDLSVSTENPNMEAGFQIYGAGNDQQVDQESFRMFWDETSQIYKFNTDSSGAGTTRNLSVSIPGVFFNESKITLIPGALLNRGNLTSATNLTNANRVKIQNDIAWVIGNASDKIVAVDIANLNNIQIAQINENLSNFPIQDFADNGQGGTTVLSAGSSRPNNSTVVLSNAGPYAGTHICFNSTEDTFDIPVLFSITQAGALLTTHNLDNAIDIELVGNHIYHVSTDDRLTILEINGFVTKEIGVVANDTNLVSPASIEVYGKYIYLGCQNVSCGLVVIDATDRTNPKIVNNIVSASSWRYVHIDGNILYAGSENGQGLASFDISDPVNPVQLDLLTTIGVIEDVDYIRARGSHVYICSESQSILVSVDARDPTNLVEIDSISITNLGPRGPATLEISGNFLYLAVRRETNQIRVYNISDPANIQFVKSNSVSAWGDPSSMTIAGNILWQTSVTEEALVAWDILGIDSVSAEIGNILADDIYVNKSLRIDGPIHASRPSFLDGGAVLGGPSSVQGRELFGSPNNVVHVSKASDFPAPIAGEIQLAANTTYRLFNPTPQFGQHFINVADKFRFPEGSLNACQIVSEDLGSTVLTYTGTEAMFNSSSAFIGFFSFFNVFCACPNGAIFDIDATLPPGFEFFPRLSLQFCGFFQVKDIGTIKTIAFNYSVGAFFAVTGGPTAAMTFESVAEMSMENIRFKSWVDSPDTSVIKVSGDNSFFRASGLIFDQGVNSFIFDIDPLISSENELLITGCQLQGDARPFVVRNSFKIDTIVDASVAGTVTSVTDDGAGNAQFNGAGFALEQFQAVDMTGFSIASYNGSLFAISINNPTDFLLADEFGNAVQFVANDSGTFTSNVVRVTTASTSGINNGARVNISGTISYDGGTVVGGINPDTSFLVNRDYVNDESPSNALWDSGSLTNTDERILSLGNVNIPDSNPLSAVNARNQGMNTTNIVQNTFTDLDLLVGPTPQTAEIEGNNRFTLVNPNSGQVRYDAIEDFTGLYTVVLSVNVPQNNQSIEFRVSKNNANLAIGGIIVEIQPAQNKVSVVTIIAPISAVTDDTFKVQVTNTTASNPIVVYSFTQLIQ